MPTTRSASGPGSTAPGAGRFTYSYDASGRRARLVNLDTQITTWVYNDAGRHFSAVLGNNVRPSYSYDAADQ